jgi:hypothetical protein
MVDFAKQDQVSQEGNILAGQSNFAVARRYASPTQKLHRNLHPTPPKI